MSDQAQAPVSAPVESVESAVPQESAAQPAAASAPAPSAEKKDVQKPPPKTYKIKVDDNEIELPEDEVIRRAQLGSAATKRFEEAAHLKSNIKKLVDTLKSNPIEALFDPALGLTKDQLRLQFENWYKKEFIDPEMLSPEQRRIKELEANEERRVKEAEVYKQQQEQETLRRQTEIAKQEYEKKIIAALENSKLPKSEVTIRAMARYLELAHQNNLDLPIETLSSLVYNDQLNHTKHFITQFEGQQLIDFLGEEIINKIRKADLARLKAGHSPQSAQSQPQAQDSKNPTLQQGRPVSMQNVKDYFNKL
jgi:hypothetical protein